MNDFEVIDDFDEWLINLWNGILDRVAMERWADDGGGTP